MSTDGLNAFDGATRAAMQALRPRNRKSRGIGRGGSKPRSPALPVARAWMAYRAEGGTISAKAYAIARGVTPGAMAGAVYRLRAQTPPAP